MTWASLPRLLDVLQTVFLPVFTIAGVVFVAMVVGCTVRYGVREYRNWYGLRYNRAGQRRLWGEQPRIEFTAGPVGNGLVWHDAVLDQVMGEFERELGMGGLR